MTGKPAARQTDMTKYGGPIIQGSLTVHIGSQGGIACSSCPGGKAAGSPVSVQLGAKVLLGAQDLDFALPGVLPVVWQRKYSSYVNAEHGAPCGLLGHGWHLLNEISLELHPDHLLLFDAAGRVITFEEPLPPGEQQYSASEDIWLMRGGKTSQGHLPIWSYQPRFKHVSAELAGNDNCILAASGSADVFWVFGPNPVTPKPSQAPGKNAKDPEAIASQPWRLVAQVDRFGCNQRYEYSQGNESDKQRSKRGQDDPIPPGRLLTITDGVGRRYRLQHQRIHAGKVPQGPWAADDGWRLTAVQLERDPHHSLPEPITLVRYGYSTQGDLSTVHDRADELVREFEWQNHRMVAHRNRRGPWHRYQYGGAGPNLKVIVHTNEQGLDYRFEYKTEAPSPQGKPRNTTIVTDSLGRVDTYRFEGQAGLNRLIEHQRADGSVMRYQYDVYGRLAASTDPLERTTRIWRDEQGNVVGVQQAGGKRASQSYDETGRVIESEDPTGVITRYRYDAYQRLAEITHADGDVVARLHYPDPQKHRLSCDSPIKIEDAKGGIKHLAYNEAGQLTSHTDCSKQSTRWKYDRWGELLEVTDAQNNTTRHERDPAGRITATKLPNGQTRRYQYNAQGAVTRIDPDASSAAGILQITRDLWGRPISIVQGGLTVSQQWDIAGRLTGLTNENAAQSTFVWDAMNRLVQETGFDGRQQRYEWNSAGQLQAAHEGNASRPQTTRYLWDQAGRLGERQLPATETQAAQIHRYEWDQANRLKAVNVYLQQQAQEQQLQSCIEFERDKLGRLTGEMQRIYKPGPAINPQIEYEHHLNHQLDPLGNRLQTELQNAGNIAWLLYGSGHVHGLTHDGQSLIDFERDALHREVKRLLHADTEQNQAITITRSRDSLGRLQGIWLQELPQQTISQAPQILVGQLTGRQYHYDALGQLAAIKMPQQLLRYGYDAAGRLRGQASYDTQQYLMALEGSDIAPLAIQRWDLDPAGNRLPGKTTEGQQQQPSWAEQVHRSWRQHEFNLLGQGQNTPQQQGPVTQWPDNRIGYHQGSVWRYDNSGNRVEQVSQDGAGRYRRQHLSYDGAHQLAAVLVESIDSQGNVTVLSQSSYIYDALGRRLKKTVTDQTGQEHITCYGWDGDRLVHTERMRENGTRDIVNTVYQPGSFTPLIRLSTTAQGQPQARPSLMVQAAQALVPQREKNSASITEALQALQESMAGMPEHVRKMTEHSLKQVFGGELPEQARDIIGSMGVNPDTLIGAINKGIAEEKQKGQTPVEILFYHCDHLGTPIALTDRQGQIAWAAKHDPWGNIEEEFNPRGIEQDIRLPGQHLDRETGLYYNYRRYYDPFIGTYINQDPIGLRGGMNQSAYASHNPVNMIDPQGLFEDGVENGSGSLSFPGHRNFYCNNIFDYTALDHDKPPVVNWHPTEYTELHFRDLEKTVYVEKGGRIVEIRRSVEYDLQQALDKCNFKEYQYLMHEGQDYFSHYSKGYRAPVGHAWDSMTFRSPDNDIKAWLDADRWTKKWADKWAEKCERKKICTF